jgi:fructose-1,6-bisphosphatase/inositol monophosphatase family enzyme
LIDKKCFVAAVREGMLNGVHLLNQHAQLRETDIEVKSDGTFVTVMDRTIEKILVTSIGDRFPDIPVLAEESSGALDATDRKGWVEAFFSSNYQVILDPIDGTRNFIKGSRQYCIAVALTKKNASGIWPVIGVVAVPEEDCLYWNMEGSIFKEHIISGEVIQVECDVVPAAQLSVNSKDRQWAKDSGIRFHFPWVSSGSSVYDFLGIVTGRNRGCLLGSQRLWDLMAPLAIALDAGHNLVDLETESIVESISPNDITIEDSDSSWGFARRFVLLRRGDRLEDLIEKLGSGK